jgi:hypothetical protein
MYKILLFVALLVFMSCTSSTTDVKEPVADVNQDIPQQAEPAELDVDKLMQDIDAETAELTPNESDVTIQDINACNVKDYKGIKKYVFCFAGGMKAQEGVFYYAEGKPVAARYLLEQYNASPANLAEHDEAKTIKKEVVLYFKNGDLRNFDKILDTNKQPVILDAQQSEEWEILIAALQ